MTLSLQAPYNASLARLLLMNNKWAFPMHLLRTSCHYKPFCFFNVVVMYLAWLEVIFEKVTTGTCTLPLDSSPTSSHPHHHPRYKGSLVNVDNALHTFVLTRGTRKSRTPLVGLLISYKCSPLCKRSLAKDGRSSARLKDKSQGL